MKPPTKEQKERVRELHEEGADVATIAVLVGRTQNSVMSILSRKGRLKMKRDRWGWAFARAGFPRYQDINVRSEIVTRPTW